MHVYEVCSYYRFCVVYYQSIFTHCLNCLSPISSRISFTDIFFSNKIIGNCPLLILQKNLHKSGMSFDEVSSPLLDELLCNFQHQKGNIRRSLTIYLHICYRFCLRIKNEFELEKRSLQEASSVSPHFCCHSYCRGDIIQTAGSKLPGNWSQQGALFDIKYVLYQRFCCDGKK